ncbi:hypothetical protein Bca52824_020395 [Brassica carinata]|uniref:Uncharacterized protein n=1 Tax=Brassica carinata TaxID=52824 RepID=A0A8X8B0J9_BRACI|nr:hypothetical protein Bca52824_020395 [Brassica carinata]
MQNGTHVAKEQPRLTLYIILTTAFLSLLFLLSLSSSSSYHSSPPYTGSKPDPRLFPSSSKIASDISSLHRLPHLRILRRHPGSSSERDRLALTVGDVPIFRAARNVDVVGRPDFAYRRGSSPMASTLHGASILLRLSGAWDWFVDLSVDEYPLVTQDELLHILSHLPKDLNFVNHTSYIGWKESRRLKPVIVDPGLYLVEKTDMFFASQKRELPKAFKLFSGPSFSILSRSFIEHCVLGTDNFPRTLLMYLSNTPASLSNYFPTILCNSNLFKRPHHHQLDPKEFAEMVQSGAAFARVSRFDDSVLDRIDRELLGRAHGEVVPGGWCLGDSGDNRSLCSVWGDSGILRPGSGSERLERRIVELLSNDWFRLHQCISE